MNYVALSDDTLLMMHHGARGALAVDDELKTLGEEPRFRVRETPDWKKHADDLETEMRRRGIIFNVLDWSASPKDDVADTPHQESSTQPSESAASVVDETYNHSLPRRMGAVIKMRRSIPN
jgi:hypothetical protein